MFLSVKERLEDLVCTAQLLILLGVCAMCMHSEQAVVRSAVSKLGGDLVVSDNVVVSTTHIVCGDNRRTVKLLMGVARGCWIVSLDWVI